MAWTSPPRHVRVDASSPLRRSVPVPVSVSLPLWTSQPQARIATRATAWTTVVRSFDVVIARASLLGPHYVNLCRSR
jgi:hypothetical protein